MTIAEIYETMEYGPAPESAKPALEWLNARPGPFRLYIDGDWRKAGGGDFETANPATGRPLARIGMADAADVDAAVSAARAAQPGWWQLGGHGRARYLYALARQVQKHARLLAVLETLENGKPIRETRDIDIPLVARHFYHHAGWAQIMAEEMPDCEPIGVAGQIIPWNFPLLMLAWKIAPALAMGNCVVLKPAEFTSLTALAFAEICTQVGLPDGVVNIITGDGSTGAHMVGHAGLDKIAFTGSTEVGRIIRRATAGTGKRLSLELGGKSPFLVFEDADLEAAVEGAMVAKMRNMGEACTSANRFLVAAGVADEFARRLADRMGALHLGRGTEPETQVGPLVDGAGRAKVEALVGEAVQAGARVLTGGAALDRPGYFFQPTVLDRVPPGARMVREEIFGPVAPITTFADEASAVAQANDTAYGLVAYVFTRDFDRAIRVMERLETGMIGLNQGLVSNPAAPFGGVKESGFGREGGRDGISEYLETKYVAVATPGG